MQPPFQVLYEDNHLLVINKPAGIATMGVASDRTSVLDLAKSYIKRKYDKPGNVYLGIVSRLDAPVTGVLVLARTSKAAARLSDQIRRRAVVKRYWAVVEGVPHPWNGKCRDWICRDDRHRKVFITQEGADAGEAQEARLHYRGLEKLSGGLALLEVDLETGRKHQIRVQLAHRGWPVYGDRKYGADKSRRLAQGIALHARFLELEHPVRKTPLQLVAPLPESWEKFGIQATNTIES